MNNPLPSGTVTFLFTDVEGSTALWEQHPLAMKDALAQHYTILLDAISAYRGRLIKTTGDGVHAVFKTALDAVSAAEMAQSKLQKPLGELQLKVRMGLHTGEAEIRAGDYYGQALNRAARIVSVAHGSQILLSSVTGAVIQEHMPAGMALIDLGEHRLKDLAHPEHIYQLSVPNLPTKFPPLQSLNQLPNNLPVQLTHFIGRERELDEARQILAGTRLLSFVGPGGIGKTRLAVQVAAEQLYDFKDGVWLVELAPLTDPAYISSAIANTLNLREVSGVPLLQRVVDYLRLKELLLILDNCEHLIDASAQISDQLLRACPKLKIIASSREAVGIAGETVYRVPSLTVPDHNFSPESLLHHEATRLFVERAAQAEPRFKLTDQNAPAVVQICRRLDGIPLAIELAASSIKLFTPEQISARLNDRFRLLTGGSRTSVPRQQTLQALIDWSYQTLTETEQRLLHRLAVFSGGWSFEAAEAIAREADILTDLLGLVNKSLVLVEERDGESRYRFLDTIRQYAMEKLLESGEALETRNRHLDFYCHYAEQADEILVQSLAWGKRFKSDYDNFRAALEWALESQPEKALQFVGLLGWYWSSQGLMTEARAWGQAALARVDALPAVEGEAASKRLSLRAKALSSIAWSAITQGDHRAGHAAAVEAATLFHQVGELRRLARVLNTQALAEFFSGNQEQARTTAEEAVTISRRMGYREELAWGLGTLSTVMLYIDRDDAQAKAYLAEVESLTSESKGLYALEVMEAARALMAIRRGDIHEARERGQRLLGFFREVGDRRMVTATRSEMAHALRQYGELDNALAIYRETILEWKELGHQAAVTHQLECIAFILMAFGQLRPAAVLFGAAETQRRHLGAAMTVIEQEEYKRTVASLRNNMDPSALVAAWKEGQALSMDKAIIYALEATSTEPTTVQASE